MRKASKKTLKLKCGTLWSLIIRSRVDSVCEWCGRDYGKMDAHHFRGKPNATLRYELKNGVCLCFKCHRIKCHGDDPDLNQKYLNWIKIYKADIWDYLSGLKNETVKLNIQFYQDTLRRLESEWTLKSNEG